MLVFWIPCRVFRIPGGFWILILNFLISRANFSHILDAPKFSPHSGIRSPLHGATRPCHFTLAFIRPRWLSSTNSSLLSTSPKGLTWLAICKVRKDYFSKLLDARNLIQSPRWYTIRIVRFVLVMMTTRLLLLLFFCQGHRWWNQHCRGSPFEWEGPVYSHARSTPVFMRLTSIPLSRKGLNRWFLGS